MSPDAIAILAGPLLGAVICFFRAVQIHRSLAEKIDVADARQNAVEGDVRALERAAGHRLAPIHVADYVTSTQSANIASPHPDAFSVYREVTELRERVERLEAREAARERGYRGP